ncbi:MAG: hypothetical protein M3340_12180, partial [Actinomycetota bacterium]|nr:hypothetical protein [Actinomycetota bacterium]
MRWTRRALRVPWMVAGLLALGAWAPSAAEAFRLNTAGHMGITSATLDSAERTIDGETLRFSDRAKLEVSEANADVDWHQFTAHLHFDDESFARGTQRLVDLKREVIAAVARDEPDGEAAREYLGEALHTLQDFYSHTNWIESGGEGIDERLGNTTYGDTPRSVRTSPLFDPGTLLPDLRTLTSGYFLTLLGTVLTRVPNQCFVPAFKTRHGSYFCPGGLNKDTPARPGWGNAWALAQQASRRYLDEILDADGVRGDARATKALMGIQGTLAVAVDVTGSMLEEIDTVKSEIGKLVDATRGTSEQPDEYVLVEFDEEARLSIDTPDPDAFMNVVNGLDGGAGGECPEVAFGGFLRAIRAAKPDSRVFLATDASAEDGDLKGRVIASAREKRIELWALATGSCSPVDPDLLDVTARTGGQLLAMEPDELPGGFALMRAQIAPGAVSVLEAAGTGDAPREYAVPVDSTLSRVAFSVSYPEGGRSVTLLDPAGNSVPATSALANGFVSVVEGPAPGEWRLRVSGGGPFSVDVSGNSPLALADFSFVEPAGRPDHEAYFPVSEPLAGAERRAAARLIGPYQSAAFELVTESGDPIGPVALAKGDPLAADPESFTGAFRPPGEPFGVAVTGRDAAGHPFRRTLPRRFRAQTVEVVAGPAPVPVAGCCTEAVFTVRNLGPEGDFDIEGLAGGGGEEALVSPDSPHLASGESERVSVRADLSATPAHARSLTAVATRVGQRSVTNRATVAVMAEVGSPAAAEAVVPRPGCRLRGRAIVAERSPARLRGTNRGDVLVAHDGGDRLHGRGGADCLYGYGGSDRLYGGKGGDLLFGGSGRDRLEGESGADRLTDDSGRDTLVGGRDNDVLDARDGSRADRRRADRVDCGPG